MGYMMDVAVIDMDKIDYMVVNDNVDYNCFGVLNADLMINS